MRPGAAPGREQGRQGRWAPAVLAGAVAALAVGGPAAAEQDALHDVLAACLAPGASYPATAQAIAGMGWQQVVPPEPPKTALLRAMLDRATGVLALAQPAGALAMSNPQAMALTIGLVELQRMAAPRPAQPAAPPAPAPGAPAATAATQPPPDKGVSFTGEGVNIWVGRARDTTKSHGFFQFLEPRNRLLPAKAGVACTIATAPADQALLAQVQARQSASEPPGPIVLASGSFASADALAAVSASYNLYDLPGLWRLAGQVPQTPPPATLLIINASSIRTNR